MPAGRRDESIPAARTSLVGRARDLDGVDEALRRCRLLTVTGPGGVGKTRLASEVARRQTARRLDGVWLVDLAAGTEAPEVATESARVLGLRAPSGAAAVDALRLVGDDLVLGAGRALRRLPLPVLEP